MSCLAASGPPPGVLRRPAGSALFTGIHPVATVASISTRRA